MCCHSAAPHSCFWLTGVSRLSVNFHQAPYKVLTLSQKHFKSADTKSVTFGGRGGISQTGKSTLDMLMQHL